MFDSANLNFVKFQCKLLFNENLKILPEKYSAPLVYNTAKKWYDLLTCDIDVS